MTLFNMDEIEMTRKGIDFICKKTTQKAVRWITMIKTALKWHYLKRVAKVRVREGVAVKICHFAGLNWALMLRLYYRYSVRNAPAAAQDRSATAKWQNRKWRHASAARLKIKWLNPYH